MHSDRVRLHDSAYVAIQFQCSAAYLMSIVLMVNEKWRERVPLWSAFQEEPNSFPDFFHCLLEACLSNIEVQYYFQWVMSSLCHTLGRQAEHA